MRLRLAFSVLKDSDQVNCAIAADGKEGTFCEVLLGILRFLLRRKHNIRTTPIAGDEQVPELATQQVIVSDTPCFGTVEKLVGGY